MPSIFENKHLESVRIVRANLGLGLADDIGTRTDTFRSFVPAIKQNDMIQTLPHAPLTDMLFHTTAKSASDAAKHVLHVLHRHACTWRGGSTGAVGVDSKSLGQCQTTPVPYARHLCYMLACTFGALVADVMKLTNESGLDECCKAFVENAAPCAAISAFSQDPAPTLRTKAEFVVCMLYAYTWQRHSYGM